MTFAFVDEHRGHWPVRLMCSVLSVSASGYSAWRPWPSSPGSLENRALLSTIRLVHDESGGSYGAPRVHAALRAAGHGVGRHRIARLMRRAGLCGLAAIPRKIRTTDSRHGHPIIPDRLRRSFPMLVAHRDRAEPNPPLAESFAFVCRSRGSLIRPV
jgi:putative transposase